jgi:alkanesulfonate monooxygenase SsuD/methylene tetrahydromethanopterin reductase-like flavin-dependent oxidoreductase (luciferase family)
VVPKPVQKPHPPLWVACTRRDTIMLAAELGIGALSFAFIDPEEARHWVDDYRRTVAERCVPIGRAVNPNIACVTGMMMAPTQEEAIARGLEGTNFFGYSLAHFYVFGEHVPGSTNVWDQFQERRDKMGYSPEAVIASRSEVLGAKVTSGETSGLLGCVGTPDQVRQYLERFEEAGVDQVIFVQQAGRNKHEDIMESLELFGTQVLPAFKERDEKRTAEKAREWEPIIEAAMARRVDEAPRMPDDFVMRALPKQMVEMADNEQGRQWLDHLAEKSASGEEDEEMNRLALG